MSCSRVWVEATQGSGMPWCLWWGRKRSWTLEILGRRRTLHHLYSSTEPTSRSVWCSGWRRLSSSLASTSDLSVAKGFLTHDKTNSHLQLSSCILLNPSPGNFLSPCSTPSPGSSIPPSSPSWGEEQGSPHRCCQSDTGPLLWTDPHWQRKEGEAWEFSWLQNTFQLSTPPRGKDTCSHFPVIVTALKNISTRRS